jgi:hypothetical protein
MTKVEQGEILFAGPRPKMDVRTLWSLPLGEYLRRVGQDRAERSWERKEVLELARDLARRIALERESREVTIDDVQAELQRLGFEPGDLGNAAGAVFGGGCWQFTCRWKASDRASNHGHQNRVWRYDGK